MAMEASEEMNTVETAGLVVKNIEAKVNSYSGPLVAGDLPPPWET